MKSIEIYKAEVESLAMINQDGPSAKDLTMLGQQLIHAIATKYKISLKTSRGVEKKVGDKKQVVNGKILKIVWIVVACMNAINGGGQMYRDKALRKLSQL